MTYSNIHKVKFHRNIASILSLSVVSLILLSYPNYEICYKNNAKPNQTHKNK